MERGAHAKDYIRETDLPFLLPFRVSIRARPRTSPLIDRLFSRTNLDETQTFSSPRSFHFSRPGKRRCKCPLRRASFGRRCLRGAAATSPGFRVKYIFQRLNANNKKWNGRIRGADCGRVCERWKGKGRKESAWQRDREGEKRKRTASELNENERDAHDKRKPVTTDRMII